jgi:hypothetical protein
MKVNTYKLIEKCVEDGATFGLNRAFKYDDAPTDEDIINEVVAAVMQELCEWFEFNEHE